MHKNLQIILITLLGYNCQQMVEVQENYDDLNKEINQQEVIPLNESNQAYKNVWEYLKQNNTNTNNVNLNKETLFYMNMHLKDIDSFKAFQLAVKWILISLYFLNPFPQVVISFLETQ